MDRNRMAPRELTDDEIFGTAPRPMTDAEVLGAPATPKKSAIESAVDKTKAAISGKWVDSPVLENSAVDVPLSIVGRGLPKGYSELGMLPATVPRAIDDYLLKPTLGRAASAIIATGDWAAQKAFADKPQSWSEVYGKVRESASKAPSIIADKQDQIRGAVDALTYQPRTELGKSAANVTEFIPGGMAMGAGNTKVARLVGDSIIPGITSEIAGRLTDDSPMGRLLGAIFGSGVVGSVRNGRLMGPERAIKGGLPRDGLTPEQWDAAINLQRTGADKFNFGVTGQEAVDAASGGATSLSNVMRVVDNSQPGGAVSKPFYAERPAQTDAAVEAVTKGIGPDISDPFVTGPRVKEAADSVIKDAYAAKNAATDDLYTAAAPVKATPDMQVNTVRTSPILDAAGQPVRVTETQTVTTPVSTDPAFVESLKRLRADPILGPKYAHLPDNSVGVIDAVTKDMRAQGQTLGNSTVQGFQPEKASDYTTGAGSIRDVARGASPEYDTALTAQQKAYRDTIQPVESGPVGRVAGTDGSTEAVLGKVFPKSPLASSEQSFSDAVKQLSAKDKESFTDLVLQAIRRPYESAKSVRGSFAKEQVGSRFANEVAGNTTQEKNLIEAVRNTRGGNAAAKDFADLLATLKATDYRPAVGSPTQANSVIQDALQQGGGVTQLVGETAKTGGLNLLTSVPARVQENTKRIWYGNNLAKVAEWNTAPDSVAAYFRPIAENQNIVAQPSVQDAMRRALLESLNPTARATPQLRERERKDAR